MIFFVTWIQIYKQNTYLKETSVQIQFPGTTGPIVHKLSRLLTRQESRKFIRNCDILRMKNLSMHSSFTSTLCIQWQEDVWKK